MDRTTLRHFLLSGPTKKFDVLSVYKDENAKLPPGEPPVQLFRHEYLNKSILMKFLAIDSDEWRYTTNPVKTLVYFPYDIENPRDGGESFYFAPNTMRDHWETMVDRNKRDQTLFEEDLKILKVCADAPTFNPFLLGDAFERANLEVHPAFLTVDQRQSEAAKLRIRDRIRPLIAAALPGADALESAMDSFVEKIWEQTDFKDIIPLVRSMGLPEEEAGDIFHAWCGLSVFEQEFVDLKPKITLVGKWMQKYSQPKGALPPEAKAMLDAAANLARRKIQENWATGNAILTDYRTSYEGFVGIERNVGPFIGFLRESKENFWRLGDMLGRLEQAVYAWASFTGDKKDAPMPYDRLQDFYQVVNQTN